MIDYADPGPPRDPNDFRRNSKDQPLVKHPDTGRDTPYGRPSKWFDDYTGVDPIYSLRGTWCHTLTEHVDNGIAWSADLDFVAAGVGLGIPANIQLDIARAWLRFKKAHGLTIVHNEATVVNDDLRVAGTLDRIVEWDGRTVVLDIKTGAKVAKTAYAVQLARYAGSVPYDVHTDTRGTWGGLVDTTVGLIAHLPLNDILKGARGVEFELVAVDLERAHVAAETLHALTSLDLSANFASATPSAGDAPTEAPHGTVVEHDTGGRGIISVNPTPVSDLPTTIAGLRALVSEWEPDAITEFGERLTDAGVPKGHPKRDDYTYMANAIERYTFNDIATDAQPRRNANVTPPAALTTPVDIDEGVALSQVDVEAAGKRYTALPDDVRSWVTVCGAKVRLSATHGGKATRRRFDILRGLCNLAEAGFDNDDIARAVLAHIIGTDEAWQAPHKVADVLATLDAAEAARWAQACDAVPVVDLSARFDLDGRLHIAASVVAA